MVTGVPQALRYTSDGQDAERTLIFERLRELGVEVEDLEICFGFVTHDYVQRTSLIEYLMQTQISPKDFKIFFDFCSEDYERRRKVLEYFVQCKAQW